MSMMWAKSVEAWIGRIYIRRASGDETDVIKSWILFLQMCTEWQIVQSWNVYNILDMSRRRVGCSV